MTTKNGVYTFILIVCVALSAFVNVVTIKEGQGWGGDFAQYIRHAQNIAEGKEYSSRIMLEDTVVSPPGFPLLLAPLYKNYGLNFKVFKLLNVVFWLLFVLVMYPIFLKRLSKGHAVLAAMVLLSSPFFFIFKQSVISDVPFVFFVTCSLWLFTKFDHDREEEKKKRTYIFWLAMLSACCAFFIRWAAVSIFIAAFLYFIVIRRRFISALLVAVGLGASIVIQYILGMSAAYHIGELPGSMTVWLSASFDMSGYILNTMIAFFIPVKTNLSIPIFSVLSPFINKTSFVILFVIITLGSILLVSRRISLIGLFFLLYFIGVLLWPAATGPRYLLPLVGFVIIFALELLCLIGDRIIPVSWDNAGFGIKKIATWMLIVVVIHNGVSIAKDWNYNDDILYKQSMQELIEWVRTETDPDDRFMFFKPRVLGLMTDRVGTPLWRNSYEKQNWNFRMTSLEIEYVILRKPTRRYQQLMQLGPEKYRLEPVWSNDGFGVFKTTY